MDWIRQLNNSRRLLAVLGLAASLVPIWMLINWASAPAFVPLYRELNWGDVGEVTEQLESAGIEYRLEAGGSSVTVPSSDLARARVLLAEGGYGAGRPGLELFDKTSWGMTDFSQRVAYRRALEGELARTIGQLRGVNRAQVHLTLPETSPLRRLERPAEAAVVVSVGSSTPLSPDVVQGIAHLVSNSVEHLTAGNVAVLDNSGRLLSSGSDAGTAVGLSNSQLELQRSVEEGLSEKALGILAQVLGEGNARVQVAADLNFEQVDRTVEAFDPDGQVIQSEQRSEPGGDPTQPGALTISHNTFQNSRSLERIVGSVGGITRLTVAVLLDEATLETDANGDPNQMAVRMANLEALVRNAVGFDATRGDQLTLAAIPFTDTPPVDVNALEQPEPGFDIMGLIDRFMRPAIALIGILFMFALALRVLRLVKQAPGASELAPTAPQAALPLQRPDQVSDAQQVRQALISDASLPETASQVVRAWLTEA